MVYLWFSYEITMKSPRFFFGQDLSPSSLSSHGDLRKIEREDRGKFQKRSPNAWKPWFNMGHTPKSGICMYILYILFIYYIYIYIYYIILNDMMWTSHSYLGKKAIDWVHRGVCYKWTGRISGPAKPQRIHAIFVDCSFLEIVDQTKFYKFTRVH
jgi:hypothetical protein